MLKNQKKCRSASSHFYHVTKAIGTHVHKGSNKECCLSTEQYYCKLDCVSMLLVKTPALRSWYLYKIAAYFSSLLSLQSLCLHSNAKTPSSVILSQHIATFFFGRLSSIVSTPHTSALIQSLSAEMGKCNFLQKKSFNSYDIRMAGLSL